MSAYPLVADLAGDSVLVVGGGAVAARRISRLLEAGARVVLVSPVAVSDLVRLAQDGRIAWIRRRYVEGDEHGFGYVFALTDDPEVNDRIAGRRGSAPTNVATRTSRRRISVPAVRQMDGVTLAVSCQPPDPRRSRMIADLCLSTLSGRLSGA